jgi:methylated-DNA-[protein]-cysteine S-methyltransferase
MTSSHNTDSLVVFYTPLGWMGLLASGKTIRRLAFGYPSAQAAARALKSNLRPIGVPSSPLRALVRRLKDYSQGIPVDFGDVAVDPGPLTEFRWRVMQACRAVPYGETITYGQLAAKAGSPGAARAVGNCMAANPIPLIFPCHRVLPADGRAGHFSAPGGSLTKLRLLRLESEGRIGSSPQLG